MAANSINPDPNALLKIDENALSFMDLPGEVRNKIYRHLFEYARAIDVTMPKRNKCRQVPSHFKHYIPGIMGTPLSCVRKEVHEECKSFMRGSNQFNSDNALTINALPMAMGEGMKQIRHLSLLVHFKWIVTPNNYWPRAQRFLAENLPALQEFELRTHFPEDQRPLIETSGKNHTRQELCALVRFQAFFVNRKPELDLLVLSESRVAVSRVHVSVKAVNEGRKLEAGDTLLDSRAIRRLTWDELHDCDVRSFGLKQTKETPETAKFNVLPVDAAKIENLGYKTWAELKSMGMNKWPMVDTLIRRARDHMKEAKRLDEEEAKRERNAETNLLAIAQAPRKNNKKGRRGWVQLQM